MAQFTINILGDASLKGLALARNMHNNGLVRERTEEGEEKPLEEHPDYLRDDADYIQHVMQMACDSYANQFGISAEHIAKLEQELADKKALAEG